MLGNDLRRDVVHVRLQVHALGAGCAGVAGAGFAQLFGYVEPSQFDLPSIST